MDLSKRFILIINQINKRNLSLYLKYGIEIFLLDSPGTFYDVVYEYGLYPDGNVDDNGWRVTNSYGALRVIVVFLVDGL